MVLVRNFERVQFASLRVKLDPIFNEVHDELSDAYYNFWRQGERKQFLNHNVQRTVEESKALFDLLHGGLWHLYTIGLKETNDLDVDGGFSEDRINPAGRAADPDTGEPKRPSKVEVAQLFLTGKPEFGAMRARIISQINIRMGHSVTLV